MPYREIADEGGAWIVFSTQPRSGANVRPRYADGWLSFHRGSERRRLSPIPEGWEGAGDDQMKAWLTDAERVARAIEDDEGGGGLTTEERRGAIVDAADYQDMRADAVPPAEPAPAATGPATRVRNSIERIRAMLSDIRPGD
jgi:hypothetical protein